MRKRAVWASGEGGPADWKQGWGEASRVGVKAADRALFEEFVNMHSPGGCARSSSWTAWIRAKNR